MKQESFNMRIAHRVREKYKFDESSITNIPILDIFIEQSINNKITLGCREVLRRSIANKEFKYGEQGLLIYTLDDTVHETFSGNYSRIAINNRYRDITRNREYTDLVFIHNHPSNETFSASDLKSLEMTKSLKAVVAVGNKHNLYIVLKASSVTGIKQYIDTYTNRVIKNNNLKNISNTDLRAIEDRTVEFILNNANRFGIYYKKYRRVNT